MKIPLLTLLGFVFLVTGCGIGTIAQKVPFDENAFQSYLDAGTATITGQAFLKTRAGDVKYGAGNVVELIPSTPYTLERAHIALRSPYSLREPRDPRLAKYVRTTVADGQGNFEFKNIPSGNYIVLCEIEWRYSVGSSSAVTGGQAVAFTVIGEGETKKVIVTL